MIAIRLASAVLAVPLMVLAPAAQALDDSGAKRAISRFLDSQKNDEATPSAEEHVIADLNGDGRPDIILMWNMLGPTWFLPKLTILLDAGRTYRALTCDLEGQTEKLTVKPPVILVDTMMPAPGDPRCCPTVRKQLRFRWAGDKLTTLK